ncbi:MAG: saccharopine dehydrogenase NADP-binding domain-containing protein [Reichenbachiella sp.]|uniref:saccharopine dehydrogenase family protein n=1 Tax=Reichenbachiella sp. TaxID=2184521 RepID=UPI003266ACD5
MKFLIYGAYGYTGKLISQLAKSKGLSPILAGRDHDKTKALAEELDLDHQSFDLSESDKLKAALDQVDLVLHCAGPFSSTAKVMMQACLATKTHYLDITGEIEVFELGASLNEEAKKVEIVLMPGVGFDVVPSDCLAAYLKSQLPDASHLELAFMSESSTSRGTALTMTQGIGKGGAIRKNKKIIPVPHAYASRKLNLDGKDKTFVSIPWGDVSTAYYSTGIPNIMVYTAMHPGQVKKMKFVQRWKWVFNLGFVQKYLQNKVKKTVTGPSEQMREESHCYLWGEVKNQAGTTKSARLTTPEGYKLTAITSLMVVEKLMNDLPAFGFQTPSSAFGADFILDVEGAIREDL